MWWIYFDHDAEAMFERAVGDDETTVHARKLAFTWGYGHYFVFGAAAAVGAGLAVAVEHVVAVHGGEEGHLALGDVGAALGVNVPVAVFLVCMWLLHGKYRHLGELKGWMFPGAASLVVAASWAPQPQLLTGLIIAACVAVSVLAGWSSSFGPTDEELLPDV